MKKTLLNIALLSALTTTAMANAGEVSISGGFNQMDVVDVDLKGYAVGAHIVSDNYTFDMEYKTASKSIVDIDVAHIRAGYLWGGRSNFKVKPIAGLSRISTSVGSVTLVDVGIGLVYGFDGMDGLEAEVNAVYMTPTDSDDGDSDTMYTVKFTKSFNDKWGSSFTYNHYDSDVTGFSANVIYSF